MTHLFIANDNVIRLDNLKFKTTDEYANAAVVSAVVKTKTTGAPVAGVPDPILMVYVIGSNGRYEGNIPETATLIENVQYSIEVTATESGVTGFWVVTSRAKKRKVL